MENELKRLEVDFEIPVLVEEGIQGLIQEVNSGGLGIDCWQEDRASINMCLNDELLTEEQGALLRKYYYNQNFYNFGKKS